jgi:nucleosome binding factor SPN SPT16 subunit
VDEQKQVYGVLSDVYLACKKALKHGVKISAVWAAAISAIEDSKRKDLISHFTKSCGQLPIEYNDTIYISKHVYVCSLDLILTSFSVALCVSVGFGMGLEFREGTMVINDKNQKQLVKGMVFNLCIGFTDLTTKATKATDNKPRSYAVLLADTVSVGQDQEAESLTRLPRDWKDVSYRMEEEGAEEGAAAEDDVQAAAAEAEAADRRSTRGVGKDSLRVDMTAEENEQKRAAHQKELSRRKLEEALKRYAAGAMEDTGSTVNQFDLTKHTIYENVNSLPPHRGHVAVDASNDCVLFPINDQLVPFHISTILRVYKRDENGFTCQLTQINYLPPHADCLYME